MEKIKKVIKSIIKNKNCIKTVIFLAVFIFKFENLGYSVSNSVYKANLRVPMIGVIDRDRIKEAADEINETKTYPVDLPAIDTDKLIRWSYNNDNEDSIRAVIRNDSRFMALSGRSGYMLNPAKDLENLLVAKVQTGVIDISDLSEIFERMNQAYKSWFEGAPNILSDMELTEDPLSPRKYVTNQRISNGKWVPVGFKESSLSSTQDLNMRLLTFLSQMQESMKEQNFEGSVFLLGSTLINRPGADIDIFPVPEDFEYKQEAIEQLDEAIQKKLMAGPLEVSEEQFQHTFIPWPDEMDFEHISETVELYGFAIRITGNVIFKITKDSDIAEDPFDNEIFEDAYKKVRTILDEEVKDRWVIVNLYRIYREAFLAYDDDLIYVLGYKREDGKAYKAKEIRRNADVIGEILMSRILDRETGALTDKSFLAEGGVQQLLVKDKIDNKTRQDL